MFWLVRGLIFLLAVILAVGTVAAGWFACAAFLTYGSSHPMSHLGELLGQSWPWVIGILIVNALIVSRRKKSCEAGQDTIFH